MKRTLARAISDLFRHRVLHGTCLATISLSVFIVSAFFLFYQNAESLMRSWQRGIRIIAYLDGSMDSRAIQELVKTVSGYSGVEDVRYISKAEAFAWLKEQIGRQSSLLDGLVENPLPDAVEISVSESVADIAGIEALASRIGKIRGVAGVEYAAKWLKRFSGVRRLFQLTGVVLTLLLFLAVFFIVANTFRLILFARADEIEILRVIGADDGFIRNPFYLESFFLGFAGGLLGILLLYLSFCAVMPRIPETGLIPLFEVRFLSPARIALILIVSIGVSFVGCRFSVKKFLRW